MLIRTLARITQWIELQEQHRPAYHVSSLFANHLNDFMGAAMLVAGFRNCRGAPFSTYI